MGKSKATPLTLTSERCFALRDAGGRMLATVILQPQVKRSEIQSALSPPVERVIVHGTRIIEAKPTPSVLPKDGAEFVLQFAEYLDTAPTKYAGALAAELRAHLAAFSKRPRSPAEPMDSQ